MPSFFEKRDRWGNGMAVYVLAVLLFLFPLLGYQLKHAHFNNNVKDWLPSEDQDAKILTWHDEHFQRSPTFLISWDDSSLDDPRLTRLVERLAGTEDEEGNRVGGLDGIEGVTSPIALIERMEDARLTREEAVSRLQGVLIGSGDLKVRLTAAGRAEQQLVEEKLTSFAAESIGVDAEIRSASTASEGQDVDAGQHDFQVHWTGIHPRGEGVAAIREYSRELTSSGEALVEDCFFSPGAPVALFVRMTEGDSDAVEEVLPAVRDAAVEVGIDEDAFHMAGTPVGQWQLDVESTKSIWNRDAPVWKIWKRSPFLLSGLVGMAVAFVLLKSLRLASLVLLVSIYSAMLCVVLVPVLGPVIGSGPELNIVLSVMPNLLLVLTASGAIHVANYWRHAAANHPENAIAKAVNVAWKPCAIASLTTAIGMASLIVSGLIPVRDFGLYSALGVVLSLGMILYGFPSILSVMGGLPKRFEAMDTGRWERFGRWVARHYVACSLLFLALFGMGLSGLRWFRTETKAIRYFPEHMRIVQDYNAIEESLAGVVTIDTVVSFDETAQDERNILERMELVRAIETQIRGADGVSGTLSLADLRPVSEPPGPNASFVARARYGKGAQRMEQEVFGDEAEAASHLLTRVHEGSRLEFLRDGERVQIAEGNEIWRIRAQTEMMTDLNYGDLVKDLESRVHDVLLQEAGVEHVVTGMVPLFLRTQQAVIESLIKSFGLAFVVIAITMIVLLRSVTSGLLSMIPNTWPSVVVFGAISLAGVPVDIGTMITASVALGIAIDGTVHLLTWFREGVAKGLSRDEAIGKAMAHCGPALFQTSCAIALAMLMLMFTDLLLVSRFGWIMSAAVAAALIADIIVTPALLAGPMGALIERAVVRQQQNSATAEGQTKSTAPMPAHETAL